MPIYGFRRRTRNRTVYPALGQRLVIDVKPTPKRKVRKHYYAARKWTERNNTYSTIVQKMGFSPIAFARRRTKETGKPVVILDWGCGNGRAIQRIAGEGNYVKCYGYGKDSYPEWNNPSRVQFIQESSERAMRYFTRLGGIDLIYSHWGLTHIGGKHTPSVGTPILIHHLKQLVSSLKIGGKIVMYPAINQPFVNECQHVLDPTGKKIRVRMKELTIIIERLH